MLYGGGEEPADKLQDLDAGNAGMSRGNQFKQQQKKQLFNAGGLDGPAGGVHKEHRPINFHAMDPSIVVNKQPEEAKARNLADHDNAGKIEQTKEFQDKFVDKVDPFGKNQKKVFKTKQIKFIASDPAQAANLGKAKRADLAAAKVQRGVAGYDEDNQDELEEIQQQPVSSHQQPDVDLPQESAAPSRQYEQNIEEVGVNPEPHHVRNKPKQNPVMNDQY